MSNQDSDNEPDVQNEDNPDDRGLSPELGGPDVDFDKALETSETVQSLCSRFDQMSVSNTTNPYGLQNNCVYVSIAHLLGQNLDDYLTTTGQMQPPSSENGISLDQVEAMLTQSGKQLFGYAVENTAAFHFDEYAQSSGKDDWGVLITRADGSGHCIVYEDNGFHDYQRDNPTITEPEASEILGQIKFIFSISDHDAPQTHGVNAASGSGTASGAGAVGVDESGTADMEVGDANAGAAEPEAAAELEENADEAEEPVENQTNAEEAAPEDEEMADGTNPD